MPTLDPEFTIAAVTPNGLVINHAPGLAGGLRPGRVGKRCRVAGQLDQRGDHLAMLVAVRGLDRLHQRDQTERTSTEPLRP
jgi:hypothetical protein